MSATIRYNWLTKIKFRGNKARIIVEDKYELKIILWKNKVIAKFNDDDITIEFKKFDSEEIAKRIYALVEKTGKFDISVIQDVVQELKLGDLCGKLTKKISNLPFSEGDKILEEFEDFLSRI